MKCITIILSLLFAMIISINAGAQLHADFTANRVEGCSPLIVQFSDLSTGGAIQWLWNLGNGVISTRQNPGVIYITPGTYAVTLYIKSATGEEDSITKTDYITVYDNPTVSFNADPTGGCVPLDVAFTDQSTSGPGTITNWLWDFGDGNTSSDQNPVHQYNLVDTFDVTLEATNNFGCKQLLNKTSYIKLNGFAKAGFTYTYNNACTAPVTITFNNTSQSNSALSYQWDFGDGSAISNDKDPKHTYLNTGQFNVKLVVTNVNGCTDTYTEEISIGTSNTNFTFSSICLNKPATFTDSSSPAPLNEQWDFGDGTKGTGSLINHTYNTKGTYVVSLITDFGGCSGSAKKTITINDDPVADFDVSGKRNTCTYPTTIQFVNKSKNATTYEWIFNNGTTSTDENPVFTYDKPGSYDVTLIAFNASGCADTVVKNSFIEIGPPEIQGIQNLPFQGCAPKTLTLTPLIVSDTSNISYKWNFGDGSTSSNAIPTHSYNEGVYDVTLIVTKAEGCADTFFIPKAVSLADKPEASFMATPRSTCASTPVDFTDNSIGNITEWKWNFGDGSASASSGPSHQYIDTGYFDITLIVGAFKCYDTVKSKNYVHIDGPIAKFKTISQCSTPLIYQFNDTSIGATSWQWDFGDGTTSTDRSSSHTYNSTGQYTISLSVSNGICNSTTSNTINVVQENPVIQYKFLSSNSCMYDSVRFNLANYNSNNVLSYQWNFDDGVTTRFSPADSIVYHPYSDTGFYTPIAIIRDINNCFDTVNNNLKIKVSGPTAAFTNKSGDCINSTIQFVDNSSAEPGNSLTKWIWNYGDNAKPDTLSGGPFNHTYNTIGTFRVLLKVIDNNSCYDTATYNNLQITNPGAAFIATDTIRCSQNTIQFIDASQGSSLNYNWDFGDGNFSNVSSPLHIYANDGVYDVKLTIQDLNGCIDSLIKPKYITVSDPVADFSLNDSVFVCPPAQLILTNKSAQPYKSILWDFGDGNSSQEIAPQHYYTNAGTYIVKLIVYGYGDCSDTMSKVIVVKGPAAILTYSPFTGCDSVLANFSAKAKSSIKYTWDFGNGVTDITKNPFTNYTYTVAGKYLPKLVLEDSTGCRVAVINNDTITVGTAKANFTATRVPGTCDSSLFDFTDLSELLYDTIITYQWQFGDGVSSSQYNPGHYYNKAGQYNSSLNIITKAGCQSVYQLPLNVTIDSVPRLFAFIPDSACVNTNVQLIAGVVNDSAANYTWLWNMGDGNYVNTNNGNYSYSVPGTYNISVSATSAAGCVGTIEQKVLANPSPQTDAGADIVICREQSANLQASGANTYEWASGDGPLSCLSCPNPVASPLVNTTFHVTGTNTFGCKATDSVKVLVKQPANLSVSAPDTICAGTTIQLKASGAELYKWSPPNLVANSTDSATSSTPLSTVTYTVIGTDTEGCFSDTALVTVNVFPIPVIQLKDSVADIVVGNSYQLIATGSPDVLNWLWMPASNISCTNCPNPVVSPKRTTTYTVRASNIAGCYTEKSIIINVSCNPDQNLFIPNTFSPNFDGTNDYFFPRGKGLMTIKSLRIFNRLGAIVFDRSNFPANQQSYGWDGKYNGKALQPDVYVYVVEIACENGQILATKGNITLLR